MKTFPIGDRLVGDAQPVYIVAEMSANHNGSFDQAVKIIEAAKAAGADAIKVQTYTADTITIDSRKEYFRVGKGTLWEGRTLHDLYKEASMPWEWQPRLKKIAEAMGLGFFSTAFDPTAVDFLEKLGVPVHKIASFELVDIPLIRKMAATGKPVILSTGMASADEMQEAIEAVRAEGNENVMILRCTSAYPARAGDMHLRSIPDMRERFQVPVGLSDHSLGHTAVAAAVSLGACLIEKHLTLSRKEDGPDSGFSLEPAEFAVMVACVRETESALGDVFYGGTKSEKATKVFRCSLYVVKDVAPGELFSADNVRSIRPGHGLHPRHLAEVIGRRAVRFVEKGTPMSWDLVDGGRR